jgi:hypothetical protein
VVQQFSVDPPAGLSFENLRPCLNFGQGYEAQMLGQNYPNAVGLPSFNCKMRASRGVRVVRFYQQSNARSWSKWKLYLGKQEFSKLCYMFVIDPLCLGERKLRLAANTNDLDRLKTLLDSGIDPKSCDEFLRTALHLAASKGYTEVVRYWSSIKIIEILVLTLFCCCSPGFCYITVLIPIKLTHSEIHLCI